MANKLIKFEDKKSEELYNWINEEFSVEKCADNPLFLVECFGALKALLHEGYDYQWIEMRMRTILVALKIINM